MVKGTSKRVVVVKSPDSRVFEQAIFIVREDFLKRRENNQSDILREAQEVADHYIKTAVLPPTHRMGRLPLILFCAAGVLMAVAVYLLFRFLI